MATTSKNGALEGLRGLASLGLERDTLVVLTADHGEGLGEHGEETHGILLHDATLRVPCGSPDAALAILYRLIGSQMDLYCLDLAPGTGDTTLLIRLGGLAAALPDRLERLQGLTGGGEVLTGGEDAAIWRDAIEFAWAPRGCALVKVPVTPGRILNLEKDLSGLPERRYSAGGQVAWIAWPGSLQDLDARLKALDLSGLVVLAAPGITGPVRLGARAGEPLERRVKAALDPQGRFVAQ